MYLKNKELSLFAIFVDMDTSESHKVVSGISKLSIPLIKIVSINGNEKSNNRRLLKPIKCRKVKSIVKSILQGTFENTSPRQSPDNLLGHLDNRSVDVTRKKSGSDKFALSNLKILVAEDNLDNQKVIQKFISMIQPTIDCKRFRPLLSHF